jgi:uncharacterized cupin superfamily protein
MIEERDGWYVVNVRDARWVNRPAFGRVCTFEREGEVFPDFGAHVFVLEPGKPNCRYHREGLQEGFLVLSGRCLLLVNGEERPLEAWDYFHCPAGVSHVLVGTSDEPCAVLAIGARTAELFYPHAEIARRYAAEAPEPTDDPRVAYRDVPPRAPCAAAWPPAPTRRGAKP